MKCRRKLHIYAEENYAKRVSIVDVGIFCRVFLFFLK